MAAGRWAVPLEDGVAEDALLHWRRALGAMTADDRAAAAHPASARAADLDRLTVAGRLARDARLAFWIDVYNAVAIKGFVGGGLP